MQTTFARPSRITCVRPCPSHAQSRLRRSGEVGRRERSDENVGQSNGYTAFTASLATLELLKPVPQCLNAALRWLPTRHHRPSRRTAEQRDELASPNHSITSSARASSLSGTVTPSALAVFWLITSSNLVGSCTGKCAGFSPRRMRSTYFAAPRNTSA